MWLHYFYLSNPNLDSFSLSNVFPLFHFLHSIFFHLFCVGFQYNIHFHSQNYHRHQHTTNIYCSSANFIQLHDPCCTAQYTPRAQLVKRYCHIISTQLFALQSCEKNVIHSHRTYNFVSTECQMLRNYSC